MTNPPDKSLVFENHFWGGLALGTSAQIAFVLVCLLFPVALIVIGVAQAVWVIPLLVYLYRTERGPMAGGVLAAAGLTVLLNGTCMAVVAKSF